MFFLLHSLYHAIKLWLYWKCLTMYSMLTNDSICHTPANAQIIVHWQKTHVELVLDSNSHAYCTFSHYLTDKCWCCIILLLYYCAGVLISIGCAVDTVDGCLNTKMLTLLTIRTVTCNQNQTKYFHYFYWHDNIKTENIIYQCFLYYNAVTYAWKNTSNCAL